MTKLRGITDLRIEIQNPETGQILRSQGQQKLWKIKHFLYETFFVFLHFCTKTSVGLMLVLINFFQSTKL